MHPVYISHSVRVLCRVLRASLRQATEVWCCLSVRIADRIRTGYSVEGALLAASPFILEQGHCFECGGHHAQAYISTYPIARMRTRKKTRTRISLRTRRRKNLSQTNRKPIQFQVTTSHNASRTQTPLRRMALSIEFETNRKPNAHTSRLACCRSAGVASRLACCQWPLCAIHPVTSSLASLFQGWRPN